MKFCNSEAWKEFIYTLLYPGILGSMIYDVSELLRGTRTLDWFDSTRFLIVILYIVDYMHMSFDLCPNIKKRNKWFIVDALLPLLFGIIYWSMTRENFTRLIIGLPIIMFLILIYPCPENWNKKIYYLGKIIPFGVSYYFCVSWFDFNIGVQALPWNLLAIVISYVLHIRFFTEYAKPKVMSQNESLS